MAPCDYSTSTMIQSSQLAFSEFTANLPHPFEVHSTPPKKSAVKYPVLSMLQTAFQLEYRAPRFEVFDYLLASRVTSVQKSISRSSGMYSLELVGCYSSKKEADVTEIWPGSRPDRYRRSC